MRIGLLHSYALTGSGSAVYTADLAAALQRAGHAVTVLCHQAHDPPAGVRVVLLDPPVPVTYPRPELRHTCPVWTLRPAQQQAYIDAVQVRLREAGPLDCLLVSHLGLLAIAASRQPVPAGVIVHGTWLLYALPRDPALAHAVAEATRALTVITLNAQVTQRVQALAAVRAVEIPPGVDLSTFRPAAPRAGVGYCGRLSLDKGLHLLLGVAACLAAQRPGTPLIIAGDGPDRAALMAVAAQLGAGDLPAALAALPPAARPALQALHHLPWAPPIVQWRGMLARREVATMLAGCAVSILPSVVPEAFPLSMLESLACGVPPLALDLGGQGWLLEQVEAQCGRRLRADPAQPIADLTALALSHLAHPLPAAALRQCAAPHRWSSVAERLVAAVCGAGGSDHRSGQRPE